VRRGPSHEIRELKLLAGANTPVRLYLFRAARNKSILSSNCQTRARSLKLGSARNLPQAQERAGCRGDRCLKPEAVSRVAIQILSTTTLPPPSLAARHAKDPPPFLAQRAAVGVNSILQTFGSELGGCQLRLRANIVTLFPSKFLTCLVGQRTRAETCWQDAHSIPL
jgi:hypothetical protein